MKRKHNYDYFEGFCRSAAYATEAAAYLQKALTEFDTEKLPTYMDEMHRIENDADSCKHEMTEHLAHEFIPPIELEDISALAMEMDNIVDAIEDVMLHLYFYNVTSLREETVAFTNLIVRCCDIFSEVVQEFRNFKKSKTINASIILVNTLESEGDKLHAKAMRRLFTEDVDTRTLLVWSTMFESMEACVDACENAADIIEGVIMKNT